MSVGIHYINTLRFSLQLLFCESFFLSILPRRKGWAWRIPAALAAYLLGGSMLQNVLNALPSPETYLGGRMLATLHFFNIFLLSVAVITFLADADGWRYMFAGVCGYATQHIGHCLAEIGLDYIWNESMPIVQEYFLFRILPYVIVGTLMYIFMIHPSAKNMEMQKAKPKRIVICGLILFSCMVLSVFVQWGSDTNATVSRIYAMIACSMGVYIQFLYSDQELLEMKNEEMEKLLHVSQSQSKLGTDAVAIINMKCHDLKHQLTALENRMNDSENRQAVKEISEAINIYDSQVKTGCDALDIVLMQKSLLCEGYHIPFDYLGNGEKLNFKASMDIAALIGNALDNAIESELKEEESARFINMSVKTLGEILLVHVDNYCTHAPEFKDGLPETTKEDKQYNGFGVKSMRYITEKYDGQMKIALKDGVFNVDMIFPLTEREEKSA